MGALLLGAVAYDPKVVTIWEGFGAWLRQSGFDLDFVLYSNYERQVEDLLANRVDVAWNSPLAWVRARRMAQAAGLDVRAVAMRDTDRDLVSAVVVRSDSDLELPEQLAGRTIGVGALDSPQATLLPLSRLVALGIDPRTNMQLRYFNTGVGLHGDHIGGEREAAAALINGQVDVACMTDSNLLLFSREGTLPGGATRVIAQTAPYDHCNMTTAPGADGQHVDEFVSLLLGMSFGDVNVRPLLELEGLTQWLPGRTDRYAALEVAVDEDGFYDQGGAIRAENYLP